MKMINTKNNIFKKVTVFFIGLLLSVLLMEFALRLIGFQSSSRYEAAAEKNRGQTKRSDFVVMTIGNSYTAGSGAPAGKSYSDKLNELLKERKNRTYKIINHGMINANTTIILERLPEWLSKGKPNLVFVRIGEPNRWNRYGYFKYLEERSKKRGHKFLTYYPEYIKEALRHLSLYRAFELIQTQLSLENSFSVLFKNIPTALRTQKALGYLWISALNNQALIRIEDMSIEEAQEAKKALSYLLDHHQNSTAALYLSHLSLRKMNNPEEALFYFKKSLDLSGTFDWEYWEFLSLNKESLIQADETKFMEYQQNLLSRIDKKVLDELILLMSHYNKDYIKNLGQEKFYQLSQFTPSRADMVRLYAKFRYEFNGKIDDFKLFDLIEKAIVANPLSLKTDLLFFANKALLNEPVLRPRFDSLVQRMKEKVGDYDFKNYALEDDLYREWVIHDLTKVVDLIRSHGAEVVVQTYPPFRKGDTREADLAIRQWWSNQKDTANIKFLDAGLLLQDKFKKSNGGDRYYSNEAGPNDEHQNELGNDEIAKTMEPFVP